MKAIFYKMKTGPIQIGCITDQKGELLRGIKDLAEREKLTEAEVIEYVALKDAPRDENGVDLFDSYVIGTTSDLPSGNDETGAYDSTWRDALVLNGDKIEIDIELARASFMHKLRYFRDQKFKELGFPFRLDKDLEAAVIPQATKAKLQELRDLPEAVAPVINAAQTPDELLAAWPEVLS